MNLPSFRSWLAGFVAAVTLVACSPPAPAPEDAAAEGEIAEAAESPAEPHAAGAPRRERRASPTAPPPGQFKYIDERGQVRLAARLEDIPESQRSTAAALAKSAARKPIGAPSHEERAAQNADVTIYTTQSCGYCRAAMAYFDQKGIEYVNHDVESDEEARASYLELTGGSRGVPVIVVGEAWMQGWSRPEFDRLLASSR